MKTLSLSEAVSLFDGIQPARRAYFNDEGTCGCLLGALYFKIFGFKGNVPGLLHRLAKEGFSSDYMLGLSAGWEMDFDDPPSCYEGELRAGYNVGRETYKQISSKRKVTNLFMVENIDEGTFV